MVDPASDVSPGGGDHITRRTQQARPAVPAAITFVVFADAHHMNLLRPKSPTSCSQHRRQKTPAGIAAIQAPQWAREQYVTKELSAVARVEQHYITNRYR
ncbi:hypothetical protein CPLU01_15541 [Colletotrichum plurivorum]|uniref:Uncharacterized protein n=1 Tax=Colletotrichum plurivorum TaxID=2175906 RepID=A0A8H6JAX2_9PEZI|nr:hypothetical protein CPLU01_15541 [Colletotrichum plurivorum]